MRGHLHKGYLGKAVSHGTAGALIRTIAVAQFNGDVERSLAPTSSSNRSSTRAMVSSV